MLHELAVFLIATVAPGPGKAATDPADLVAGIVLSNHVDAATLDRARVLEAAGAGEPWRAAPGVFFAPAPAGQKALASGAVRVERLEGGWLWIRVRSLVGGGAPRAIRRELEKPKEAAPVRGIILDLRSLEDYQNFEVGAQLAALFAPEGSVLFSLEGRGAPRQFTVREAAGMLLPPMAVIVNAGTAGVGEATAESLRRLKRAVIFGSPTAGRAAEYGAAELPSGRILRVPSRRVGWGEGGLAFHDPVRPDIGVVEGAAEADMLRREAEEGPVAFIAEVKPRPRQNEAALVRGENPELEEAIRLRLEASTEKGEPKAAKEKEALDEEEPADGADAAPAAAKGAPDDGAGGKVEQVIRDETLQRTLDFLRGLDALGLNRVGEVAPPVAGAATNAVPAGTNSNSRR